MKLSSGEDGLPSVFLIFFFFSVFHAQVQLSVYQNAVKQDLPIRWALSKKNGPDTSVILELADSQKGKSLIPQSVRYLFSALQILPASQSQL